MNKLTHEEEKILKYGKITNTIAKDIGELIETRLEEEEITLAVVVAPHLKHEGPDIDKLKQNLKDRKKNVNNNLKRNMAINLNSLNPLERRKILSNINHRVKGMKKKVDNDLMELRLKERVCGVCKKVRLDCRCQHEIVEDAKRSDQCLICFNFSSRGILPLHPCGHRVICDKCLHDRPLLRKCPLDYCRRDIIKKGARLLQEDYRSRHEIKGNNKYLNLLDDWK